MNLITKCLVLSLLSATLVSSISHAQRTQDCFPVWQGFTQAWSYPQRMMGFGDQITRMPETDSCKLHTAHYAACGKPDDIAHFAQYYDWVQTDIVQSYNLQPTFNFSGREGEMLRDSIVLDLEIPSLGDPDSYVEALLSGFLLAADNGAQEDNLQRLDLEIDSIWRKPGTKTSLSVKVSAAIQFSCRRGDCEPLNQVVEYRLTPTVMVLAGQGFRSTRSTFGSGRSWEKQDTSAQPPMARVALLGDAHYHDATAGIRGLHIQLDREHSMLAWESRVLPLTYKDGLLMTGVGMNFRQNDAGMYDAYHKLKRGKLKLPAKCVLKPKPGSMIWEMDVVLLQFEDAKITPKSVQGKIEWVGKFKDRDGAAAYEEYLTE